MIFQFNGQEFLDRFSPSYTQLSNCIKTVVLPDGRVAQMQITITTNEDDFCTKIGQMSAVVARSATNSRSDEW